MTLELFSKIINSPEITLESAIFKLIFSIIAGGMIGINRERQKQAAGFRTHILICLGSALLMLLSIYIPQTYFNFKNGDPGRIAAQVVTGIGFLGAGAIIRLGTNVRGITTAASIWLVSAVGLSIGAGMYTISLVVIIFALFTLIILERAEHKWLPQTHIKTIFISFSDSSFNETEIKNLLKKFQININHFNIEIHNINKTSELNIISQIPDNLFYTDLIQSICELKNVVLVKIV